MEHSLGTEAIRAYFTLQCCWLNNEEIYIEKGCLHCGSAATYLIYFTNQHIQKHMLNFIQKYRCVLSHRADPLDLPNFDHDYEQFLQALEAEVNFYARQHHDQARAQPFEQIESIFERQNYSIAC